MNELENKIQSLEEELKTITAERDEYLEGWKRMKADVQNRERQFDLEKSGLATRVREDVFVNLFTILDSFNAAFKAESWKNVDVQWQKGVEYIYSQILQMLQEYGVKQFGAVGDIYDSHIHDLSEHVSADISEGAKVTSVLRFGYISEKGLLRSALVVVQ